MKSKDKTMTAYRKKRKTHYLNTSLTFLVLWEFLIGVLVTGLIFGGIVFRFFLISLEGTSVPVESIENTRRATDLTSFLRMDGQKREEFITSQFIQSGVRPLSYEEMLVYIEEYNLLQKQGKILEYKTDEGVVKFLGYVPGRVSTQSLPRQTSVRNVSTLRSNGRPESYYNSDTAKFLEKNGVNMPSLSSIPYLSSAPSKSSSPSLTNQQNLAKLVINRGVMPRTTSISNSLPIKNPKTSTVFSTKNTLPIKTLNPVIPDTIPPIFRFQTYKGVYGEGYRIYIYFDEFVEGFDEFDIKLENGKITRFSRVDAKTFYVDIVSNDPCKNMFFSVPEKSLKDESGNENKASKILNLLS